MAAQVRDDVMAVTAAEILISLTNRNLRQWPEWVPLPSPEPDEGPSGEEVEEEEEEVVVEEKKEVVVVDLLPLLPARWLNRRPRSPRMPARPFDLAAALRRIGVRVRGVYHDYKAAAPVLRLPAERKKIVVKVGVKSEQAAASPPSYYAVGAGSGGDRARPRSRPRRSEKEHAKAAAVVGKEVVDMDASSPETPLDYAAAAAAVDGSGSSSSGDDAAQPSRKRKGGSGGASSSGDEVCSSPEKRAHRDAGAQAAAAETERVKFSDPENRNYDGVLMFDLNECPVDWEY